MICHMHPGTNMVATYQGLTWWDNETDGDKMYPPSRSQRSDARAGGDREAAIPKAARVRGLWSRSGVPAADRRSPEFNSAAEADAVRRLPRPRLAVPRGVQARSQGQSARRAGQPRHGSDGRALTEAVNYTDLRGRPSKRPSAADGHASELETRAGKPVHLKDIHLERGMQCVDCHFKQDSHGNGKLYGEPRNAIEIACVDCHGTRRQLRRRSSRADRRCATTGPARTPDGARHATCCGRNWRGRRSARTALRQDDGERLLQRSMVDAGPVSGRFRRSWTRSTGRTPRFNPRATGQAGRSSTMPARRQDRCGRRPQVGRTSRTPTSA